MILRALPFFFILQYSLLAAEAVEGKVLSVDPEARTVEVEISKSGDADFKSGDKAVFHVNRGDSEIGYLGRRIQANASFYNKAWHLEQIFPLDGDGAREVKLVNRILHRNTAAMKGGKFLREGHTIPDFGMINQHGEFVRAKDLQGKPFMLNFIFTRCQAPEMCPASSTKMELMQEKAREAGLTNLHFVTISFDPAFDSPGIMRSYGRGYGMEFENYHLLTGAQKVVDDLLRQVGILTMEEDGTINHTIATLLVDAKGRIAYREEGPSWKVENFLEVAREL